MTLREINNHFGDMDLFLMDLILKGYIKEDGKVLDVGCGEGRNGLYFIQQGYEYHGWDTDSSKLKLLKYLSKSIDGAKADFRIQDLKSSKGEQSFDFIICSRVLHFAKSETDFRQMWQNILSLLKPNGILYVSMDSIVDSTQGKKLNNGLVEFPDSKVRFVLTNDIYKEIKKGFEEIEPLRTLVHHNERTQSFFIFRKT
ncbi:class I SAM-dependent methyltransferase [Ekhidna sp.]